MPNYIVDWRWALDSECSARSTDGDPYVLYPNWGSNTPWLQIIIVPPFPCEDWATIDVREIEGPGTSVILPRPLPRIVRGQASTCNSVVRHAQCAPIATQAEGGRYRFEAIVGRAGGGAVRSELLLEYRN